MRPADDLASELRRDAARPWLTWYDDADGARIELSVATTANWVAKIANWLLDEHDVQPGDLVSPTAGTHWLAPLCVLAGWTVGAELGPGGVALPPAGDATGFQRTVLAQPDVLVTAASPTEVPDPATDAPSGARVLADAAADLPALVPAVLRAGGSLVLVAHPDVERLPAKATAERVTHTVGLDVAGLPHLG